MAAGDLTKIKLSGGTDGKNIKVVATATAGTLAISTQANGRFVVASSATQLSVNKNAFVKNFTEAMG